MARTAGAVAAGASARAGWDAGVAGEAGVTRTAGGAGVAASARTVWDEGAVGAFGAAGAVCPRPDTCAANTSNRTGAGTDGAVDSATATAAC